MQRILVVDDTELNCELLRNILKDGYIIDTAKDGEQALSKIREYPPRPCGDPSGSADAENERICSDCGDEKKGMDGKNPCAYYQQRAFCGG